MGNYLRATEHHLPYVTACSAARAELNMEKRYKKCASFRVIRFEEASIDW